MSFSTNKAKQAYIVTGAVAATLCTAPVNAQDRRPESVIDSSGTSRSSSLPEGEIVVTARKREETSIAVPVVLTAVGAPELERRAINTLDTLARVVPSLVIGEGGTTLQGGNIAIRGIGGADTNPLGDQAVSFNVDGVQIARATVRRLAFMDVQQVEILKGPQALFFGKNSPAGIISIRSADPTDTLQAKLSAGYEFNAREIRVDGFVAGPLTEGLGARLAFYGSRMRGWSKSIIPETSPYSPEHKYAPRDREYAGRLTLRYDSGERFDARAKLSYSRLKSSGATANFQLVDCVFGTPQPVSFGSVDECKADDHYTGGGYPTSFAAFDSGFRADGQPYSKQWQLLGSLEMNYAFSDAITLTSVSGYYKTSTETAGNFNSSYNPATIGATNFDVHLREFNQELRLNSDFDFPVNFTLGAYYQNAKGDASVSALFNGNTPTYLTGYRFFQKGRTHSAYGQLRWNIVPTLELAGGARYSNERKRLPRVEIRSGANPQGVLSTPAIDEVEFSNWSPEMTLTWRPTDRLTVFGAYKTGFLSGGFNTGSANIGPGITYRPEKIKGFEAGVKALLLDGALRTNLSLYNYKLQGLQVTATISGGQVELRNAAGSRIKGAEFDFNYRTPLEGLDLRGAVAYNHARYTDYIASCYRGQPAPDCALRLNPISGQMALSQDLSGTQLVRAPNWTGNLGFSFQRPVSSVLKFGLSGDMTLSSGYFSDATSKPGGRQHSYQLFDATVRIGAADDRWEVALVGRNLTDEYYFSRATDTTFTGSASGLPADQAVIADTTASVSRGREVMLRFTVRFGGQ